MSAAAMKRHFRISSSSGKDLASLQCTRGIRISWDREPKALLSTEIQPASSISPLDIRFPWDSEAQALLSSQSNPTSTTSLLEIRFPWDKINELSPPAGRPEIPKNAPVASSDELVMLQSAASWLDARSTSKCFAPGLPEATEAVVRYFYEIDVVCFLWECMALFEAPPAEMAGRGYD
jgi:hypothetical protein